MKSYSYTLLALFIICGPAVNQVFKVDIPELRTWIMYGTVGVGAPYGHFEHIAESGITMRTDILEVLKIDHVRDLQPYPGSGDIKQSFFSPEAYRDVAVSFCSQLSEGERLRFNGRVAARHGWVNVNLEHEQLCPDD